MTRKQAFIVVGAAAILALPLVPLPASTSVGANEIVVDTLTTPLVRGAPGGTSRCHDNSRHWS